MAIENARISIEIVDDNGVPWQWDEVGCRLVAEGDETEGGGYTCLDAGEIAVILLKGGFIGMNSYLGIQKIFDPYDPLQRLWDEVEAGDLQAESLDTVDEVWPGTLDTLE